MSASGEAPALDCFDRRSMLGGSGAMACEKHLNGHQNSSDTNTEGAKK
jgi:hypothetical protein